MCVYLIYIWGMLKPSGLWSRRTWLRMVPQAFEQYSGKVALAGCRMRDCLGPWVKPSGRPAVQRRRLWTEEAWWARGTERQWAARHLVSFCGEWIGYYVYACHTFFSLLCAHYIQVATGRWTEFPSFMQQVPLFFTWQLHMPPVRSPRTLRVTALMSIVLYITRLCSAPCK